MSDLTQYEQFNTEFFSVHDTIGVPHLYCISSKHVVNAADNFGGMLGDAALQDCESKGIYCAMQGCQLSYKEHETALVINCKNKDNNLLKEYLLSIKSQCKKDKYAGFVLIDCMK
ncbi:MAG: hypothetical protein DRQ01_00830 [Ignavibacteriae bacterium]|nr:MAG: hypothetical protein DRQ01_00830 [Ignavibacteriota bacterium]